MDSGIGVQAGTVTKYGTPLDGPKEQVDHPGIDKQGYSQISNWFSVARDYGNHSALSN